MTHTTHSSQRILACVERYEAKKVVEYQGRVESDANAVLVRSRRHYERWGWLFRMPEPTYEAALKEAKESMGWFDHAMLNQAKDRAEKWRLLLAGTETVELSLEDSWILNY